MNFTHLGRTGLKVSRIAAAWNARSSLGNIMYDPTLQVTDSYRSPYERRKAIRWSTSTNMSSLRAR
jgi:hypothetical protein